jgi:hypothetical protein
MKKTNMILLAKKALVLTAIIVPLGHWNNISGQDMTYRPGAQRTMREANLTLPFTSVPQQVNVEVVDGVVVVGGDMVLGPEAILSQPQPNATSRGGAAIQDHRWPDNTIYYVIHSGHPAADSIRAAIQQLSSSTNLRFVERTSQPDYVEYIVGDGCWSYIGKQTNRQEISIGNGCGYKYIIMHETLHAAGMFHEQSRRDRDYYVTINEANIIPTARHNFDKYTTDYSGNDLGIYDFESIMHYGPYDFSSNGNATITANPASVRSGHTVHKNYTLSPTDIQAVNHIYPSPNTTADMQEVSQTYLSTRPTVESIGFDVIYNDEVELVPQSTPSSCWAAALAMIVGWRDQCSISPEDIANGTGHIAQYNLPTHQGGGLAPDDTSVFEALELQVEQPLCYTVDGFRNLLSAYGPLWVAANVNSPHVFVITGIRGDGTPDGTIVYVNDPLERGMTVFNPSNRGERDSLTYREFMNMQEDLAWDEIDLSGPIYVVHP